MEVFPDVLYLVECSSSAVHVYSRSSPGMWRLIRQPKFDFKIVFLRKGKSGWVIEEEVGNKSVRELFKPKASLDATGTWPPLGTWQGPPQNRRSGGQQTEDWTLIDEIRLPGFQVPDSFECAALTLRCNLQGRVLWEVCSLHEADFTDETFQRFVDWQDRLELSVLQRPIMIATLAIATDSAVPSMKHVQQLMRRAKEKGHIADLVTLAIAVVLQPTSVIGSLLLGLIKFCRKMVPSPIPLEIFATQEEGRAWLERTAADWNSATDCKSQVALEGTPLMPTSCWSMRIPSHKDTFVSPRLLQKDDVIIDARGISPSTWWGCSTCRSSGTAVTPGTQRSTSIASEKEEDIFTEHI